MVNFSRVIGLGLALGLMASSAMAARDNYADQTAASQSCLQGLAAYDADSDRARLKSACTRSITYNQPPGLYVAALSKLEGWNGPADVEAGIAALIGIPNFAPAKRYLGQLYYDGQKVPQDDTKALGYFRQAAMLTDSVSVYKVGVMLYEGRGAPADQADGTRLIVRASEFGVSDASAWLAAHPEVDADAVSQNFLIDIPAHRFTWPYTQPDGTVAEVDFRLILFRTLGDHYPARALDDEVEGSVLMECKVSEAIKLENCIAISESPKGYQFAYTTLRVLPTRFRIAPEQQFEFRDFLGGRAIRFMIKWQLS